MPVAGDHVFFNAADVGGTVDALWVTDGTAGGTYEIGLITMPGSSNPYGFTNLPGNLDTIQQWQDDSLRLFSEVARGGERQAWWEGFLASYYKIALPMGLRPTAV